MRAGQRPPPPALRRSAARVAAPHRAESGRQRQLARVSPCPSLTSLLRLHPSAFAMRFLTPDNLRYSTTQTTHGPCKPTPARPRQTAQPARGFTAMRFDIFTLFPEMLRSPLDESIIARARERGLVEIYAWNPRDVTTDRHHIVDDYPYGGGAGMVMKPDPIFTAVERIYESGPIILMSPQGRVFSQAI